MPVIPLPVIIIKDEGDRDTIESLILARSAVAAAAAAGLDGVVVW